jgi:hypothetical protein
LRDTYLTGNPHGWLIFGLFRADYLLGNALHAVMCSAGNNIRLLLKKQQLLFTFITGAIIGNRVMNHGYHQLVTA